MCPYIDEEEKFFVPCKDDYKAWYDDCKTKGFPYFIIAADTWNYCNDYYYFDIKEKAEVFYEIAKGHDLANFSEIVEIYSTEFEFEEQNREGLLCDTSSTLMFLPKDLPVNAQLEKLHAPMKFRTQPQPYPKQEQISEWFYLGKQKGMKYLLIVEQSSFYSDYYPFYVNCNNNLFTTIKFFQNRYECKVIEAYNLNYDFFKQYKKCLLSTFDSRAEDENLSARWSKDERTEISDYEYYCYVIREYIGLVSMNEGYLSPLAMGAAYSLIRVATMLYKKQPTETIAAALKAFGLLNARFVENGEMKDRRNYKVKYVHHKNIYQIPIMVVLIIDEVYFPRVWPEISRKLLHDDSVLHSFAENCLFSARDILKEKLSFFDTITEYIRRQRNFNKLLSHYWISEKADEYYHNAMEKWPNAWEETHKVKPDPAIFKKSDALNNLFEDVEWLLKQYEQEQKVYPKYYRRQEIMAQIKNRQENNS